MIPIITLAFYDNLKSVTLLKSQSVVAQNRQECDTLDEHIDITHRCGPSVG